MLPNIITVSYVFMTQPMCERESVCVCVCERESVCVCVCERERERECVCV